MPAIRNSSLFKKFTDFFGLKTNDMLDSEAGRMLVPVITHPILPLIVRFAETVTNLTDGIRITVPAGRKWEVVHLSFTVIADAGVGNRFMKIQIRTLIDDVQDKAPWNMESSAAQAASQTFDYNCIKGIGLVSQSVNGIIQMPLPTEILMTEGDDIEITDRAGISTGDIIHFFMIVKEENLLENELETRAVTDL